MEEFTTNQRVPSPKSPTMSYASLTASNRPVNSLNKTKLPIPQQIPRKEFSILNPEKISLAIPLTPGTQRHSVFYQLPLSLKNFYFDFLTNLSNILNENLLGIAAKDTVNGKLVEVSLPSEIICEQVCSNGAMTVNDITISATRALPPSHTVMKVSLSKLPLLQFSELSVILKETLSAYGIV
ncbi:hypothetical protein BDB01DRAFT_865919 [Pilobolus umbonatus]|nr:hypothetical protein BDB01DRAFT_865919 [Pilobolus umbonatus]